MLGIFAVAAAAEFLLLKLGLFRDASQEPSSARRWGRLLGILVGFAFVLSGLGKVVGLEPMVEKFTQFNMMHWFPYVGVTEIVVGSMLVSPATTKLGVLAGSAMAGGAISTHLPAHSDGVVWAIPSSLYLALLWLSAVLYVPEMFPDYVRERFHRAG